MKHPIQPLYTDEFGHIRFHPNRIVEFLLDKGGFDMNKIAQMEFSDEDREQFAQLVGYSLSGFSELSYVSDETYEAAKRMFESGETEEAARVRHLEALVSELRDSLRQPIAALYGIHPDDL